MFKIDHYLKLINDRKLSEALEYRKLTMPKTLYKYISLSDIYACDNVNNELCKSNKNLNEKKFETLSNNKIWLSRFDNLNDPYEYRSMYLKSKELINNGWPVDTLNEYLNNIRSNYLIGSFTTDLNDNMPMWAHYANNHKGFCVEYNVLNSKILFPISYESQRVGISSILTNFFNLSYKVFKKEIDFKDKEFQFYTTVINHFALIKHKSWNYEKEYRILYADCGQANKGVNIPILKTGLGISKIYIGIQCSDINKERLVKIAEKLNVKIYQMYLDNTGDEYKLSYKSL